MTKYLAALAVAGLASTTFAAVNVTVTPLGAPTDGIDTLTGYTAYKVTLTSTTGKVSAVDFSGSKAFSGPLAQSWFKAVSKAGTTFTESPFSTDSTADVFDSHFIVPGGSTANILAVGGTTSEFPPLVDNPLSIYNPAAGSGQVWGDSNGLGSAFGIVADAQSDIVDIAYLVIPDSVAPGALLANPQIATTLGGVEDIRIVLPGEVIPEPASLGLLALGGLALLRRRR